MSSRPIAFMTLALAHACRCALRAPVHATGRSNGIKLLRMQKPPRANMASDWRPAGAEVDGGQEHDTPAVQKSHFLIENSRNSVSRLMCPTRQVLQQGIIETAALPHVCIAGESNAGKSSLINHLLRKKNLAKASSVAGKTRSVDMMLVNERVVLTDLPGLPSRDGQVTAMWEGAWRPLVMDYVNGCDSLVGMLYIHDVRWKISSLVREFLDDVRASGLPVLLVLSKDDKLAGELREPTPAAERALREKHMKRVRRSLGFEGVHLHYSTNSELAFSRKARRRLLRYIESMVESGSRDECARLLDTISQDKFAQL